MPYLKILLLVLFLQLDSYAKILSRDTISIHIQNTIQTHIKEPNKTIIQNIYKQSGNRPLWITQENEEKMSQLIQALKDPFFNYKDKSFDQKSIATLFFKLDNNEVSQSKKAAVYARLDLMLTNSFVRLVRFIVQGDIDWNLVQKKLKNLKETDDIKAQWEMSYKSFPDQKSLISAAINGGIHTYLQSLIPMEKRYKTLIELLKSYRVMNKFPKINYSHSSLQIGEKSNLIIQIKNRLQISGDYPKTAPIDNIFDVALKKAVITYQKRYLLKVNGMINNTMIYYLNQPVTSNIQAIITNLDKTKLYPKRFEDEYVEVNIPDFNLRYYKDNVQIMKMGLVVGRLDRPTPIFENRINYMVLNPTWTIPDSLVKKDLIHVLRKNPLYLKENNIHVFSGNKEIEITQKLLDPYEKSKKYIPYRFVQFPGKNNALGRIKFMFPNKYAVYLHDTDNKSLLSRRYKLYSSGCMRTERPFDLMDILLKYSKDTYSRGEIEEILLDNETTTISLNPSIPIHILYFTVYKEDGLAYFKNDIYLYDKIIEESAQGHKKETFLLPKKRMISVKKDNNPLSN